MVKSHGGGRNVAALLGINVPGGDDLDAPEAGAQTAILVPVGQIVPDSSNPRKHFDADSLNQLAASLKEQGMLQPLLVVRAESEGFSIVDGERRYRAAILAGMTDVPAYIREFTGRGQIARARLTANVQRNSFTPGEEAHAYLDAIRETDPDPGENVLLSRQEDGLPNRPQGYISNRGLAHRTGIPSRRIDRAVSLLRHKDLLARVEAETLSYAEALEIIGVRNEEAKKKARTVVPDAALPTTGDHPHVATWTLTPENLTHVITEADAGIAAGDAERRDAAARDHSAAINRDAEQIERYHREWKPVLQLRKWCDRFDPASVPPEEKQQRKEGLLDVRKRLDALIAQLGD